MTIAKKIFLIITLSVVFFSALSANARALEMNITPTDDVYTSHLIVAFIYMSFLKFNISDFPADANITTAELFLYKDSDSASFIILLRYPQKNSIFFFP